jgi:PAS domain S-box-containing protein
VAAVTRAVGEALLPAVPEEVALRDLAGRLSALLGRTVVIQTARPASASLNAAETSGEWAGPEPRALALIPAEAADLELVDGAFVPLARVEPLSRGATSAARAVLSGPQLSGVVSLERKAPPVAAAEEERLAFVVAGALAGALVIHRRFRRRLEQERLATAAFRQTEALLCVLDADARVALFNGALERLTGFPEPEVLGAPFAQWLGLGGDERLTRIISDTLGGRPSRAFEASLPLKTGGCVSALITAAPVYDEDHAIGGVALVGLGQHHLSELAARQEARATRLRRVTAGVALKLMQPAAELATQLAALREALPVEDVRTAAPLAELARIRQGLDRLAAALGALSSSAEEPTAPVAVNQVVEAALKETEALFAASDVRVRTALAGELPDIQGVGARLVRAVVNLLVNACQAGTQRVTVRTWDNRDGTIGLSVADSGEGIGEQHLAHVFQPFYTARADGVSVGLGLAEVQDAVDVHQGTVDIDSGEGEGTVVTITLPVRRPGRRLETADEA